MNVGVKNIKNSSYITHLQHTSFSLNDGGDKLINKKLKETETSLI